MASRALHRWQTQRARALDEVEDAHASVGGSGRGRGYATQQLNQAYAVLLASQFQGFCRDLHTEAIEHFVGSISPASSQPVLRDVLTDNRKLDQGNANAGNIGADMGRFGPDFWERVYRSHGTNRLRRQQLDALYMWRNAIAHQHFDPARLGGRVQLHLRDVHRWRRACNGLGVAFDRVLGRSLATLTGSNPW